MESLSKSFYLLALVFLVLGMFFNFLNTSFPKLPGDILIEKPGIRVYIPFTSALIISVILTIIFNFFRK